MRHRVLAVGMAIATLSLTIMAGPAIASASPPAHARTAVTPQASRSVRGSGGNSGAVSLSGWTLILPVNSSGGLSGNAEVLNPARLDSPWLTQDSTGALDFFAPAVGATTPGSTHSRTELVSQHSFTLGQGNESVSETIQVNQVPKQSGAGIIIAQFLSLTAGPYAHVEYNNGTVYLYAHGPGAMNLMTGVPLGATFQLTLASSGTTLSASMTYNGQTATVSAAEGAPYVGAQMYFHAGDYQQATSSSGASDGGKVVISALSTSVSSGGGGNSIVNTNSGLCLATTGASSALKTTADIAGCDGSSDQQWAVNGSTIVNGSGVCLSVTGGSTSLKATADIYTCNGSPAENWSVSGSTIVNINSGLCLSVSGGSTSSGSTADIYTCNGSPAENWQVSG